MASTAYEACTNRVRTAEELYSTTPQAVATVLSHFQHPLSRQVSKCDEYSRFLQAGLRVCLAVGEGSNGRQSAQCQD